MNIKVIGEVMNTAKMWLKAQEDGKTYECVKGGLTYSKEMGLVDRLSSVLFKYSKDDGFDRLLSYEWKELSCDVDIEKTEIENVATREEENKKIAEAIEYWIGLKKTFMKQLEVEDNYFGRMHLETTIDVLNTTIDVLKNVL